MPRSKIAIIRSGEHNEGWIVCPYQGCEYSVKNELGIRLHLRVGHGVESNVASTPEPVCSVCRMRFRNVYDMRKHASKTGHYLR